MQDKWLSPHDTSDQFCAMSLKRKEASSKGKRTVVLKMQTKSPNFWLLLSDAC